MKNILKNKSVQIAIGISVIILILTIIFSPKKTITPSQSSEKLNSSEPRPELIDLSKEKRNAAMIYVSQIEQKLPLYLASYKTSVGIDTSINIYRVRDDEAEIVRLEIYGLSYMNQDTNEGKNPNVTAFKESYAKAIEMLESQNIYPKKLVFIYGDKEYVRSTSEAWIRALKLHP
jgi:uncharacterized secreted protein with C-terminal beta-propeller domain